MNKFIERCQIETTQLVRVFFFLLQDYFILPLRRENTKVESVIDIYVNTFFSSHSEQGCLFDEISRNN